MRFSPPSRGGLGYAQCDRSGFLVPAEDRVEDIRGGLVRPQSADITPGFGTHHPSEVYQAPEGPDPVPIQDASYPPVIEASTTVHDIERERRLRDPKATA